jgi:hypothetical protein
MPLGLRPTEQVDSGVVTVHEGALNARPPGNGGTQVMVPAGFCSADRASAPVSVSMTSSRQVVDWDRGKGQMSHGALGGMRTAVTRRTRTLVSIELLNKLELTSGTYVAFS